MGSKPLKYGANMKFGKKFPVWHRKQAIVKPQAGNELSNRSHAVFSDDLKLIICFCLLVCHDSQFFSNCDAYSMFHVTWTTFKFNRSQLGTVSAYVMSSVPLSHWRKITLQRISLQDKGPQVRWDQMAAQSSIIPPPQLY